MPSGEFRIALSLQYQERTDVSGNSYAAVRSKIPLVDNALWSNPQKPHRGLSGISSDAAVIIEPAGFKFGIKLFLEKFPDATYVSDLDRAIPPDIPKDIPIVLEVTGHVRAAGDNGERQAPIILHSDPGSAREKRQFYAYIFDPFARSA